MVTEIAPVADAVLPVTRLKDHLRLGGGFAEDQIQDGLLAGFLRAALAAIEGQTGKALLRRDFEWQITAWRDGRSEVMPVAPVVALIGIAQVDAQGTETVAQANLRQDMQQPALVGAPLPAVPEQGFVKVVYTAGYAVDFDHLPADLSQAVMLLAAHYYEHRNETALGSGCMPFGVSSLIDRYRPMRLTLGGAQ